MTLIATVMLVVFVSIVVLALSTFIFQRLILIDTNHVQLKNIYLAQAGVQGAIYSYRLRDLSGNGYFPTGQYDIDTENNFVLGGTDADLFMVDNTATYLYGLPWPPSRRNRNIGGWPIQNACNTRDIEIDRMIVTWDNGATLRHISIDGRNSYNRRRSSGQEADIRNFTLRGSPVPPTYPNSFLRFNQDMTGATVDAEFIMVDGSSRTVRLYPSGNNFDFTVKSTGKIVGSDLYRTIEADYNAITGEITNYYEIDTEIVP